LTRSGKPYLLVANRPILPHQFLKRMFATRNWRLIQANSKYYHLKIGRHTIKLLPEYFHIIYGEWDEWKKYHLPPFSLKEATVLDVGAGCGETALFYFIHGVERVICVESNPDLAKIIVENLHSNNWNATVQARSFDTEMLNLDFDFMKMDCEGCETQLLSVDTLPACVMEVHDRHVLHTLTSKFGLRVANAETVGKNSPNDDFERRQFRMYYLGWRFTRVREKFRKAKGLRRLYYAIVLVILELHPDFANVYRARWGRVWETYYFPNKMHRRWQAD
jgi:Met-10+ like-protein